MPRKSSYLYSIDQIFNFVWQQKKGSLPAWNLVSRADRLPVYEKKGRSPTLPHRIAVPSAQPDLTSLFGMGRGGTPAQ